MDDGFATTHWTVVLAAGRQGNSKEAAEDLTQAFFASFLVKDYLEGLSAERDLVSTSRYS